VLQQIQTRIAHTIKSYDVSHFQAIITYIVVDAAMDAVVLQIIIIVHVICNNCVAHVVVTMRFEPLLNKVFLLFSRVVVLVVESMRKKPNQSVEKTSTCQQKCEQFFNKTQVNRMLRCSVRQNEKKSSYDAAIKKIEKNDAEGVADTRGAGVVCTLQALRDLCVRVRNDGQRHAVEHNHPRHEISPKTRTCDTLKFNPTSSICQEFSVARRLVDKPC
jgi:hypothetical protein